MRRFFWFGTGIVLLVLGFSVSFLGGGNGTLCSVALAQDNACLEQEATISALQLEMLSAQMTMEALNEENENLQATISVLEAQGDTGGNLPFVPRTSVDCQPYPISETFDDNSLGISTITQEAGRARVDDGTLELRYSSGGKGLFVPLPGICIQDNFYIEVTMQALEYGSSLVDYGVFGLAIGNADQADYHLFSINSEAVWITDVTGQTVNEGLLHSEYGDVIPNCGRDTVRFGLESRNGIVTIYINDEQYDAYPISFKGDSVAAFVGWLSNSLAREEFAGTRISFDNFIARVAR